jgi:hypothetical protein
MGGEYITFFTDDGDIERRKALYKLENFGLVIQNSIRKGTFSTYVWKLTEKGKQLDNPEEVLEGFDLEVFQSVKDFYKTNN